MVSKENLYKEIFNVYGEKYNTNVIHYSTLFYTLETKDVVIGVDIDTSIKNYLSATTFVMIRNKNTYPILKYDKINFNTFEKLLNSANIITNNIKNDEEFNLKVDKLYGLPKGSEYIDYLHYYIIAHYLNGLNINIDNITSDNKIREVYNEIIKIIDSDNVEMIGKNVIEVFNGYVDNGSLSLDFKDVFIISHNEIVCSVQFKINGVKSREWWEGLSIENIELQNISKIVKYTNELIDRTIKKIIQIDSTIVDFDKLKTEDKYKHLIYQINERKIPNNIAIKIRDKTPYHELVDFNVLVYLITILLHDVNLSVDDIHTLINCI